MREEPTTFSEAYYRNSLPWEMVDNFKVNKWMLKIGAEWQFEIDETMPSGFSTSKGYWVLYEIAVSQTDACKWYLASHSYKWWRFWK